MFLKRLLCFAAAIVLILNTLAVAESEDNKLSTQNSEEHFVPENPDMDQETIVELDLTTCRTSPKQNAQLDDSGLFLTGGNMNKCAVSLPYGIMKGQRVKLAITGCFTDAGDKGIKAYLTDDSMNNCSKAAKAELANDGCQSFVLTVELIADSSANAVMIAPSNSTGKFMGIRIEKIELYADEELLAGIDPSVPYAEAVKQSWYAEMLKNAQVSLGNNKRLKALVDRAAAGEHITIATIGGSITEGAGAKTYQQCYAYKIWEGFKGACDLDSDANVSFVNAGVGGTPSTFGWMRYQRDIVDRVNDTDSLPDLVVIEYSVNDGGEPTNHQCFESMVKQILAQPNEPVVIILFAVFPSGYNLQSDLKKIGETYDLMMVSIKDGPFKLVGSKWTESGFFYDQYHPTTLGHAVMADCVLSAISDALALEEAENDIDLNVPAAYGTAFMGIRTIYKHSDNTDIALDAGSFKSDDSRSYTNYPIGRVCGENFFHAVKNGNEPLTFTAEFKNFMIAYRTMSDSSYGRAVVYIDGVKVRTLTSNTGSWGQSVVDLIWSSQESALHTVTICMAEGDEDKKFTITCMGITE